LQTFTLFAYFLLLMTVTPIASAYIGPGSGISIVGSLLGLLATIFLAVGAIVIWPYRRMLKKRMQKKSEENDDEDTQARAPRESVETTDAGDGNAT
jgi:membrane protein implicated in regulation of membrane protease activity